MLRPVWGLLLIAIWTGEPARAADLSPRSTTNNDPAALEFFEKEVRPLLANRCFSCHGAQKQKAGLRLDSRASVLKGGETGPAVVPRKPGESLLVEAINYGENVKMPPRSRLPAKEVETLTRWVEMGLPWPASPQTVSAPTSAFDLAGRRTGHWAWSSIADVAPPSVKDQGWPLGPEDRFILAKLEAKGLKPAPEADRNVLIRRLSFDLTGLPPTPDDLRAFVNDSRPDAYERLVDRLLASPEFGERWGRHWLDLVRYAETRGHEFDPPIPNAWQYRDYVIRALNADVPYDQFVTEHIAGDLIAAPRLDPKSRANESILGTGFWFLGEEVHSPVDLAQDECDRFDNRLDVTSKTFLGLTVACARCHDHKFDAISQRDYYALSGFLMSSNYRQVRFTTSELEHDVAREGDAQRKHWREGVSKSLAALVSASLDRLPSDLLEARHALIDHPDRKGGPSQGWEDALRSARSDIHHPFHPFAAAVSYSPIDFQSKLSNAVELGCCAEPWSPTGLSAGQYRVLCDFSKLAPLTRFQNGFAFGLRPVAAGDVVARFDGPKTTFAINDMASVRRDPAFATLPLAKGTETDHGRIGQWDRAGQTLRSTEFSLGKGSLYYLVKGAGRAYASMNSHLIVAGPLHGAVMTEWTDGGVGWRWVHHDLSAYEGHRAHIEFCGSGSGEFAVASVIQSETPPRFTPRPNDRILTALSRRGVDSPEAMANAYRAIFQNLANWLNVPDAQRAPNEDQARLADFVLRSRPLFHESDDVRSAFNAVAHSAEAWHQSAAVRLAWPAPTAPAIEDGNGVDGDLLIRGSPKKHGPVVPRRFLEALVSNQGTLTLEDGSGRLALAGRMTARSNPFTSRVYVNRVWHHLFGRGIVASVDNFGVLGERPTHPELLDFLAGRFMREGWSTKRLIRSLVLSRTYRMSSRPEPASDALDPDNLLLHRRSIRRLEAEPIRDAILALSGRLDRTMGGPSVPVHLTDAMQGRGRPGSSGPLDGAGRRSVYLAIRRNFLAPMMLAFDAPIPFSTMGRRNVSNVPAQALILMNDPFIAEESRIWAHRVRAEPGRSTEDRVRGLYLAAFSRDAAPDEIQRASEFLRSQAESLGLPADAWASDDRAWADLAHMLINSKEFVFLP